MSKMKMKFIDPATRKHFEVEAERLHQSSYEEVALESSEKTSGQDGKIDLVVKESRWWWSDFSHVGVDTNAMSLEEMNAFKRAVANPQKASLRLLDAHGFDFFSPRLQVLTSDIETEISHNIDITELRRGVQLTPTGLVATSEGKEPTTLAEKGEGLFRLANLIDDEQTNLLDAVQAPHHLKEKMLSNFAEIFSEVRADAELPEGLTELQKLQTRSCLVTSLLELVASRTNQSEGLSQQAFALYKEALESETNPTLRESMVNNLDYLSDRFSGDLRVQANELVKQSSLREPPYNEWFKDGNTTLKVDWPCGFGEGFLEDNVKQMKALGFEVIEENNGKPIMRKTYEEDGVETTIEIHFRNMNGNIFDAADDEETDIIIYSGHSNWGRNVRDSLEREKSISGKGKLMMTNLCVGKGELQMMREHFPGSHQVTTFNSGYFIQGSHAEWHGAARALFEGIAKREDYEFISTKTKQYNRWQGRHQLEEGIESNYIFPTDQRVRKEVLDQDHDGQADVFDRLVDFNTFKVETDTEREFQAIPSVREAGVMDGTKVHIAAMGINRNGLYNELFEFRNSTAEVIPHGYFEPVEGETSVCRFIRDGDDIRMEINSHFSHMSEEAMRMISAYEYSQFKSQEAGWPLDGLESKLHSLLFASHSLSKDAGHRDQEVWSAFLEALELPEMDLYKFKSKLTADKRYYSGSVKSVEKLKETLSPELLEQLS